MRRHHRPRVRRRHNWIKGAMRRGRSGALRRELHVPAGKKIPIAKLRKAAKKPGKLGKRARFALTMRKLKKKHHHKKHHHKKHHHGRGK